MMKRNKPGIMWKLFAYLLGFCVLLLIILTLFQTVFLDKFYIAIKRNQVEEELASISTFVEECDWESLEAAAEYNGDLFVEVWSADGTLIISSGSFRPANQMQPPPEEVSRFFEEAKKGGWITEPQKNPDLPHIEGMESVVSTQLVEAVDGSSYTVVVNARLSPINATVETLKVQLVYISVIMLVLSVCLALFISRQVSKPIVSISRTAAELGKGNYKVVFHGTGYREVVQLADALTETADELSKTEELRRELIANVSHDLRTPLTLIAGYSEMIRDMPEEANPDNMQVIIDESKRLSALVNDLLDLSQLQAGVDQLNLEVFDLDELTQEIVGRVSRFCEPDGYQIAYAPGWQAMVCGDRSRIAQVIYNFLLNAIAHTGDDRRVSVALTAAEGQVRLSVSDSGSGIAEEEIPYIWDRYYQGNTAFQRATSGTGLGLSIVRSILDWHENVTYGVDASPGEGSVFWFTMTEQQ